MLRCFDCKIKIIITGDKLPLFGEMECPGCGTVLFFYGEKTYPRYSVVFNGPIEKIVLSEQ